MFELKTAKLLQCAITQCNSKRSCCVHSCIYNVQSVMCTYYHSIFDRCKYFLISILREVGSPKAECWTGGSGRANVQGQWHSIVFQYRRHSLVQHHQILIYSSHFWIGTMSNRTLWYPLVFAIVPRQDGARTCCYKLLLGLEPNHFVWLSFVIIIWEFCAGRPTYLGVFAYSTLEADTIIYHLILFCIVMYCPIPYLILLVSRPNK